MLFEHQHEYPSQWQAIESFAERLSIHRETMQTWVRRAETDAGHRSGPTSDQLEELKALRRENAEVRRANDILKAIGMLPPAEFETHHYSQNPTATEAVTH